MKLGALEEPKDGQCHWRAVMNMGGPGDQKLMG